MYELRDEAIVDAWLAACADPDRREALLAHLQQIAIAPHGYVPIVAREAVLGLFYVVALPEPECFVSYVVDDEQQAVTLVEIVDDPSY